jgi:hypothetical protein
MRLVAVAPSRAPSRGAPYSHLRAILGVTLTLEWVLPLAAFRPVLVAHSLQAPNVRTKATSYVLRSTCSPSHRSASVVPPLGHHRAGRRATVRGEKTLKVRVTLSHLQSRKRLPPPPRVRDLHRNCQGDAGCGATRTPRPAPLTCCAAPSRVAHTHRKRATQPAPKPRRNAYLSRLQDALCALASAARHAAAQEMRPQTELHAPKTSAGLHGHESSRQTN